jgi:hypothetical protein
VLNKNLKKYATLEKKVKTQIINGKILDLTKLNLKNILQNNIMVE